MVDTMKNPADLEELAEEEGGSGMQMTDAAEIGVEDGDEEDDVDVDVEDADAEDVDDIDPDDGDAVDEETDETPA